MVEPTPLCHHQTTKKCGSRKYETTNPWRSLNKQKRDLRFWEKSKKIKNEFWNGVKMLKVRSYTYSKKNQTNNINYTLNFSYDKWMNIWFNKCLILNIDTLMHFLPIKNWKRVIYRVVKENCERSFFSIFGLLSINDNEWGD